MEERSPLPPSLPPHGQVLQTAEPLEEVGRELGQGVLVEEPVPAFHPDRQIASQSRRCKRAAHREIMRHRRTSRQEGRQAVASGRVSERVIGVVRMMRMDTYRGWKRSWLLHSLAPPDELLQTAEPLEEVGRELRQGVL